MRVSWILALIVVAWSGAAVAQEIDGPPGDWLAANTPYGFDITPDGKVWVNTNPIGQRDDYAILGNDLYAARNKGGRHQRLWIRGYHRRNPDVEYRETKMLVSIDCVGHTIVMERAHRYNSDGMPMGSAGPIASEPIVPGSMGEGWEKAACPK